MIQLHLGQKAHPADVHPKQGQVIPDSQRVGAQQRSVAADGQDRLARLRRQRRQRRDGFPVQALPNPRLRRRRDLRAFQRLQYPFCKQVRVRLTLVHKHID